MRGKEGPKHIMCMYETVKEQKLLLVKLLLQGLHSRLDKSESQGGRGQAESLQMGPRR